MIKIKNHKFILISATVIVVTALLVSYFYVSSLDCSVPTEKTITVLSADEYEERFYELAKERYEALKKQSKGCLVAHADDVTAKQIETQTRYTDKFLDGSYSKGIDLGIDIAVSNLDVQKVGEDIELRFKSFYETTGKVRLLYQAYVDGRYQTLFTETVTCYCLFVPSGSVQWYNGTLTPPDMPNWSLGGVYPNDMCFERQLDTGDTQYFVAKLFNPDTQSVTATNYSGGSKFGVTFNFWHEEARVIDSTGTHTFSIPYDHPIRFVSSDTNNIDRLQSQSYNPDKLTYSSNISVATLQEFYCSYIGTNDRPENTSVINERVYKTFNNYDYRKFPIYRVTNKNYQSYDNYANYETKYYNNTYVDNGLTIDPDTLKTTIDYDKLSNTVSNQLEVEFKSNFDSVYKLQPDIDTEFNQNNNVFDYPSIVDPLPPSDGCGCQPPTYPSVNTEPLVTYTYPVLPTNTVPQNVLDDVGTVVGVGFDTFDTLGASIIGVFVALAVLGAVSYYIWG